MEVDVRFDEIGCAQMQIIQISRLEVPEECYDRRKKKKKFIKSKQEIVENASVTEVWWNKRILKKLKASSIKWL